MRNRVEQLDELLGLSIAELDIPDPVYRRAIARYQAVSEWLAANGNGEIYTQGSIRLGTMIAPITAGSEYDVDSVCRLELDKGSISQAELKARAGAWLEAYVATGPDGLPVLKDGKRCWTLNYPREPFHMDVLPAIPDPEAGGTAILLTDRELRKWQHSNPKEFAAWFEAVMAREAEELREALSAKMDIEQAPPSQLKTTLQRAVQALKRHRDMQFRDRDHPPASIIITTLAARAYRGGGSLSEVLTDVSGRMADQVERRAGVYWVANPVHAEENFADRWRDHPERAEEFFAWIERAHADFASFGVETGLDRVIGRLSEAFGAEPTNQAALRVGTRVKEMRRSGVLGVGATGVLGTAAGRSVPDHTFHGDAPPTKHRS